MANTKWFGGALSGTMAGWSLARMARDLLFPESMVENHTLKGCNRVWEPGSDSCLLPGGLPAANCAFAAAKRVLTAAMLRKSRDFSAKCPGGALDSSRSETRFLHLLASSTLV